MLPNPGVEGVPSVGEHQESAENQDRILPRLVVLVPDHFDHVIVGEAELIERELGRMCSRRPNPAPITFNVMSGNP
jgi:hypothetical protein